MRSNIDYDAIELEYIQGPDELSIRQLAKNHGIASWSAVSSQANKREWKRKRAEFRHQLSAKVITAIVDQRAEKVAEIQTAALDVILAAIYKMASDMTDKDFTGPDGKRYTVPGIVITPSDLAKLIDKVQVIGGQPSSIEEHRNLGLDLTALPADVLSGLARVATERGADAGPVGRAALPGPGRTSPTN